MTPLNDRVVVVTGAATGIGRVYADRLAADGARLVLSDIAEPADAARLNVQGRSAFVRADIRDAAQVSQVFARAIELFGRCDALVNNAALFTTLAKKPFEDLSVAEWEQVLGVNVIGPFLCTKHAVEVMKKQGSGKIINIASNVVHKGLPQLLHYVASKGAIVAMTRALARELGPHGITVNAVAPGYVYHEGTAARDGGRNEVVKQLRALGRTLTPDDLAGTIAFLCSADSDPITGQTIVVDCGEVFA